jgi:hypothetical protein
VTANTALWDKLGRTDPAHTKTFKRAGGFSGTAIKPMWSYRRMTEEFGPCGEGWGINEPSFQVVPGSNNEVLVYCTVSVWFSREEKGDGDKPYRRMAQNVYGVGGDKIVTYIKANDQYKRPERWENDDEAFKKAYTDAVTNALKMIGVGADVHMGMFDDNKYVNTMTREFAEQATPEPPPKSSSQLKKDGEWERVSGEIANAMNDVFTFGKFQALKESYREEARKNGWNRAFTEQLKDLFIGYEEELQKRIDAENEQPEHQIANEMGGRIVNEHVKDQAA